MRERPLLAVRSSVGHPHYFTRATALASLQTAGFEIVCDRLLHPRDIPGRRVKTRLANMPRSVGRISDRNCRREFWAGQHFTYGCSPGRRCQHIMICWVGAERLVLATSSASRSRQAE